MSMSAEFRGAAAGKGDSGIGKGMGDTAYEAMPEHPPYLKFGIGVCEFLFGLSCNFVQVVTSTIGILALVLGSAIAVVGLPHLMGVYPYAATIALVIACAIQLFLHKNAQSMSGTYHRLRQIQHFNIKSVNALSDVKEAITVNSIYFALALAADIISDATFVNLYTHNAYVIVGWMLFLTGSSTLLMYDGATRVWGAIEDFKDYAAYHAKHDAKDAK
jgi:hypothetical protein